ncbi:hypothetical protein [Vibrio diazotrophicus]|uniref:hypothetical protein n=1 Tax=Vibrio diazotrophicus TaxID=685 RepID=UPI003D2F7DFA
MEVDNNIDDPNFDEDAAFEAAIKEVAGESTAVKEDDSEILNNELDESDGDPLGQEGTTDAINPDGEQEVDEVERLRAENARLNHSLKSEKGRSQAATKRWQGVQQKLQQVAQGLSEDQSFELDEDFKENFPELAEHLEKGMAKVTERNSQSLKSTLDPMQSLIDGELESLQELALTEATNAVAEAVPDAQQILQNPEFNKWLDSQPAGVKGLFDSDDPNDAIYLLTQFKERPTQSKQVQSRRELQKRSLISAGGRPATPKSGDDIDDEDALWATVSKRVDKEFGR